MTSTTLLTQTYTDTYGGRLLREMDEAAERSMRRALSSEVITESQKAVAWVAFHVVAWPERMALVDTISRYVRDVLSGKRAARPDVAPPVVVEGPQAEAVPYTDVMDAAPDAGSVVVAMEVETQEVEAEKVEATVEVVQSVLVPMWVGTPQRESLPADLSWSGLRLPAVAQSVQVVRWGRPRPATVVGYFHAEGFLGIEVQFEGRVPDVVRSSPRSQCFFGSELRGNLAA